MSCVVTVIGSGQLADILCEQLSGQYEIIRQLDFRSKIKKASKMVLVLHDEWDSSFYITAERKLKNAGMTWLCGFVSYEEGVIGPLVRPGTPGCSQCADMRHRMAGGSQNIILEKEIALLLHGEAPRHPSVSRLALVHMGCLIAAEVLNFLKGRPVHTEEQIYLVDLKTLKSSLHPFLPDPLCPVCGRLPDDSPENARIILQPSPKIGPGTYRCRSVDDLKEVLAKAYVDERTGLLNGKRVDLMSSFSNVMMNLPSVMGDEVTVGRSHSYTAGELSAILEGLERYCGILPRSKRTVIHDCFRNLAHQALNPSTVGLYSAEQYAQPDFPFQPFDPEVPMSWVWGYSLLEERSILVPEQLAYYSLTSESSFVQEGSNGCALGGSLEEAIFYGILEVVERDSFLLTWYGQLSIPRLDPYSAQDKELQLMVDRLQMVAGYDVFLFNMTMETGIPSIWAMVKNNKTTGANLICAAGAHLDPIRAAKSAIFELAGNMIYLDEMLETNREEYVRMFNDPSLVSRMEDHSALYSLPEAEERLQFLLETNRPLRTFNEEFKHRPVHEDLTEDLKDILRKFKRLKLNVIVINQTTQETIRNGLYCVKVLIPGMLPITFGHHLSRLSGLERVLRIPMEMGYKKKLLQMEKLNRHPHPFL